MPFSVRSLQLGEMINLSSKLLGEELGPTVEQVGEFNMLRPQLEDVHGHLIDARGTTPEEKHLYDQLGLDAGDLDSQHDHLGRAGFYTIKAAREYRLSRRPVDTAGVAAADEALDTLYPDELSMTRRSYSEQAGNAMQMAETAKQLDGILRKLPVDADVTLADLMAELGTVGKQLSEVERKRKDTEVALDKAELSRSEVRARMRAWATVIEAVIQNLRISRAPADAVEAIYRHIEEAADKATARRRARRRQTKPDAEE